MKKIIKKVKKTKIKKSGYVITTFIDTERKFTKITDEKIMEAGEGIEGDETTFSMTDWCELTNKGMQTYPWFKNTKVKIDEFRTLIINFYRK